MAMSASDGFYRMYRGWTDCEAFAPEPFTQREAWEWLIEHAAWRDGVQTVGKVPVKVQRGQLAASVRFLADAWGWGRDAKTKVTRFLERLTRLEMVSTSVDPAAKLTIIHLTNYAHYQGDDGRNDDLERDSKRDSKTGRNPGVSGGVRDSKRDTLCTASGTASGTANAAENKAFPGGCGTVSGTASGTKRREESLRKESIDHRSINASETLFEIEDSPSAEHESFEMWWSQVPRKVGKGQARRAFTTALRKVSLGELVEGIRRYAYSVTAAGTAPAFIAHPTTWLNGERWLDDLPDAEPSAPTSEADKRAEAEYQREYDIARAKGPLSPEFAAWIKKHRPPASAANREAAQ